MNVIIIGGGIGGLSAGLALYKKGIDVQIFEQAKELTEAGAGVGLSPNAVRVLYKMNLKEDLDKLGVNPKYSIAHNWSNGEAIYLFNYGEIENMYGAPSCHILRKDLLALLIKGLPSNIIHLNKRLINLRQTNKGVELDFEDGNTCHGDIVIGADGIHSTVRNITLGGVSPSYSGITIYRGLIPVESVRKLGVQDHTSAWLGQEKCFLSYRAGKKHINITADVTIPWLHNSNKIESTTEEMLKHFKDWCTPVPELISNILVPWKMPLITLPPLINWRKGKISLLGDAAHPVYHFIAQGAGLAIEDADILAKCLKEVESIEHTEFALAKYEKIRKPRTTKMQLHSKILAGAMYDQVPPKKLNVQKNVFSWIHNYDTDSEYYKSQNY